MKTTAFQPANFFSSFWLALLFLPLLAGCATKYQEPSRAENTGTIIEAVAPVWIVGIDGKTVSRIGFTGDQKFSLFPGARVIELGYSGGDQRAYENWRGERRTLGVTVRSRKNLRLSFAARPGHHYYAHAGVIGGTWHPYINEAGPGTFLELPTR